MIRQKDIEQRKKAATAVVAVDYLAEFKKLYQGFSPDNSTWDRRMLYEVTGKRINPNEFKESDTSEGSQEEEEDTYE